MLHVLTDLVAKEHELCKSRSALEEKEEEKGKRGRGEE